MEKRKILTVGHGKNIKSDLKLAICKMKLAEYTVVAADQKTIDQFCAAGHLKEDKKDKVIFVPSPMEVGKAYILTDEKLKYSILSGKKIIDRCIEMEIEMEWL